jgi:hypothetical protein
MLGANNAASASAVFHHHGLAQNTTGCLGDDAAHNVV